MQIQVLLITSVDVFVRVLEILIFIRIILSWFPIGHNNPIAHLIFNLTEPILGPVRKLMHKSPLGGSGMMLDFSPIISIFLLQIVAVIIKNIIVAF